jgi:hypothetical protein
MKLKQILLIVIVFFTVSSYADSPLTSTPFYKAYSEVKEVKYALEKGLDNKMLKFLGSNKANIVTKIAVINALSWGNEDLVGKFEAYLLKKRKGLTSAVFDQLRIVANSKPEETDQTKLLTADDLICWVYLQVMGDYNNPAMGMRAGFIGFMRDKESMAHMVPFSLIASQKAFDTNWCNVYQIPHKTLEEDTYTKNNISDEALKIIMDYINMYKQDCK